MQNQKIYELTDVDLIVKVVTLLKCYFDDCFYHKVVFADKEKRLYFSEILGSALDLEEGTVVKLRSVHVFATNN